MHINVLDHEPHEALFVPDADPLVFYRHIKQLTIALPLTDALWLEANEVFADADSRSSSVGSLTVI